MAGLTKEQRAERAAQRAAQEQEHSAEGLVAMVKAGEVSHVHPSTVKSHQAAGWKLKD